MFRWQTGGDDSKDLASQKGSGSASHILICLLGRLIAAVVVTGTLFLVSTLVVPYIVVWVTWGQSELPTHVNVLMWTGMAICPSIGAVLVWRGRRGFYWSGLIVLAVSIIAAAVVGWADSRYRSVRVGVWIVVVMVACNLPSFVYGLVEALRTRQARAA